MLPPVPDPRAKRLVSRPPGRLCTSTSAGPLTGAWRHFTGATRQGHEKKGELRPDQGPHRGTPGHFLGSVFWAGKYRIPRGFFWYQPGFLYQIFFTSRGGVACCYTVAVKGQRSQRLDSKWQLSGISVCIKPHDSPNCSDSIRHVSGSARRSSRTRSSRRSRPLPRWATARLLRTSSTWWGPGTASHARLCAADPRTDMKGWSAVAPGASRATGMGRNPSGGSSHSTRTAARPLHACWRCRQGTEAHRMERDPDTARGGPVGRLEAGFWVVGWPILTYGTRHLEEDFSGVRRQA